MERVVPINCWLGADSEAAEPLGVDTTHSRARHNLDGRAVISIGTKAKESAALVVSGDLGGLSLPWPKSSFLALAVNVSQARRHHHVFQDNRRGEPPIGSVFFIMRVHKVHEVTGIDFLFSHALVNSGSFCPHPRRIPRAGCSCPTIHHADQIAHLDGRRRLFPNRIVSNKHRVCGRRYENIQHQRELKKWPYHNNIPVDELQVSRGRPSTLSRSQPRHAPPPVKNVRSM
jgi:hypothetical protein